MSGRLWREWHWPRSCRPLANADEPGTVSPAIIDGGNASNAPWAARLFVNGQENCSATIIAPTWILTAQHCVDGAGTYTFHIGSLDQTQGEQATGVAIHEHPSADLALVELDHAVTATYSPLGNVGAVESGETVQVYGWGATCTDRPEIECQSQLLKVANVNVSVDQLLRLPRRHGRVRQPRRRHHGRRRLGWPDVRERAGRQLRAGGRRLHE